MKLVKGVLSTSAVALALTLGYGYAITDAANDSKEFVPQTKEEEAWANYVDEAVKNKMFEAYDDAFKSFEINPDDYSYYSMHDESSRYKEIDPKLAVRLRVAALKAVKPDIKSGDFMPGIFVKKDGSKAFVTFKELDTGENHIYWFATGTNVEKASARISAADEAQSNPWVLEKKEEKDGTKLEKLELQNLQEFINNSR
ncbi:hypothetical protein BAG01nite_23050 [Brevibacillus agri]|uniref:Uncharacterized protein n=1 Tax=Brevibacillus agri TaxID=51101 RepID=A0A3M8B7H7_9BACL|nr:hypothetical protein [Brevibacillus agri]QAV12288.1 hypothetical protein BA6348_05585 [Brevibacillus agri]RNB59320.1 hypothetical protein EB820_04570 [Brevibacillus agri]GED26203.1 hypothetical protein BAG01nite_23050 [Brevibacillus agri]